MLYVNIDAKFNTGNIDKIITEFHGKGYEFTDHDLKTNSGIVTNIDIVIGTQYDHILPMREVVFGKADTRSCFKKTRIGVLLSGSVPNLQSFLQSRGSACRQKSLRTEKYFLKHVEATRNQFVFTIFRLIWN